MRWSTPCWRRPAARSPHRTVVGLTSDTPDSARQTAKLVENLGGRYLDGAIMTPTPTIGTSSASILFAGPRETYEANRELFAALAEPSWLGEEYGRAAGYDMALLDLFWTSIERIPACTDGGRGERHRFERPAAACTGHRRHPSADLRRTGRTHRSRPARSEQRAGVVGRRIGAASDRRLRRPPVLMPARWKRSGATSTPRSPTVTATRRSAVSRRR